MPLLLWVWTLWLYISILNQPENVFNFLKYCFNIWQLRNYCELCRIVYVAACRLHIADLGEHNNSALFKCNDSFSRTAAACVYSNMPVAGYKHLSVH